MMEKSTLSASLRLMDERVQFEAEDGTRPAIRVDGVPPIGHGDGHTPMHLFLVSFASCEGITLASMIRDRMRRRLDGMTIEISGDLRKTHPKAFTHLRLHIDIASPDATGAEVERALASAERSVCPVWAMVKGNVEVETTFALHAEIS